MSNRADDFSGTFPTPSDAGGDYTNPAGTFSNSAGVCSETGGTHDAVAVLESSSAVGKVQFDNPSRGTNNSIAIVIRYVDASNYMVLYIDAIGGFGEFFKVVSGSKTHLDYTGSYTSADGDTWSLEVDGSNAYTFKHNGTTVNWFTGGNPTLTDATNSTGTKHGFGRGDGNGTSSFDNFSFTDAGGGGGGGQTFNASWTINTNKFVGV